MGDLVETKSTRAFIYQNLWQLCVTFKSMEIKHAEETTNCTTAQHSNVRTQCTALQKRQREHR